MSTFNKQHTAIKINSFFDFFSPFILYSGSKFLVLYWGMFFFKPRNILKQHVLALKIIHRKSTAFFTRCSPRVHRYGSLGARP